MAALDELRALPDGRDAASSAEAAIGRLEPEAIRQAARQASAANIGRPLAASLFYLAEMLEPARVYLTEPARERPLGR